MGCETNRGKNRGLGIFLIRALPCCYSRATNYFFFAAKYKPRPCFTTFVDFENDVFAGRLLLWWFRSLEGGIVEPFLKNEVIERCAA